MLEKNFVLERTTSIDPFSYIISHSSEMYGKEFPLWLSWLRTQCWLPEDTGSVLDCSPWSRIWHCWKLQHRFQMWLKSCIPVAMAETCSDSTSSLKISICLRCSHLKKKKKKSMGSGAIWKGWIYHWVVNEKWGLTF